MCADIGSDSKPYQDAGYDVRLIGRSIGVENYHPPEVVALQSNKKKTKRGLNHDHKKKQFNQKNFRWGTARQREVHVMNWFTSDEH